MTRLATRGDDVNCIRSVLQMVVSIRTYMISMMQMYQVTFSLAGQTRLHF